MKIIMKITKYLLLTLIFITFILNLNIVVSSARNASILFFNKIFITIFPFIILSDILIYFDYHVFLKNTIGKIISKLFNIDPNVSIIFILSMLTSSPANAIYIKDMLDNNQIDIDTANRIICFTYFPSISFVIGTIGVYLYNSYRIGLFLWILCFMYNILIGIFTRNKSIIKYNITLNNKNKNLSGTLRNSILKGINTSILILGNLIIFTVILNIINKYININEIFFSITSGLIELTSGIINISLLNISLNIKLVLTFFILSFNGLSILFQSFSILSDYKINILKTLIIKLVFSLIMSILLIIIFCL